MDKLKGFEPKQTHVHAAGVLCILALAATAYTLGYGPLARAQAKAEIEQASIDRSRAESIATAGQVERMRLDLKQQQRLYGDTVDQAEDPEQTLRESAARGGIQIGMLVNTDQTDTDEPNQAMLAIQGTGTFLDISDWFVEARTDVPGLVIRSFTISATDGEAEVLSFQAVLSVYTTQPVLPGDAIGEQAASTQPTTTAAR